MRAYDIPRPIKGENRFLVIFSNRGFAYTIGGAIIGVGIYQVVGKMLGFHLASLIIGGFIVLLAYGLGEIKIPKHFMVCGGMRIDTFFVHLVKHSTNKCIYVYKPNQSVSMKMYFDRLNINLSSKDDKLIRAKKTKKSKSK